jgi:N utilization substance protein B
LPAAEKELLLSMDKAYDLYHYLLLIIVMITEAEQRRVDRKRFKPFMAELDQNLRLYNNRLAEQLRTNKHLQHFANERGTFWNDENEYFIRQLLNRLLASDYYAEYLKTPDNYDSDKEFWRKTFKHFIIEDPDVLELIENNNIYWVDDVDLISTFSLKSLKRFSAASTVNEPLLPMYREESDRAFALKLLHHAIVELDSTRERIVPYLKNWDVDRLAQTDLLLMQIALSELLNFPEIPVSVTLNEYIDLSRYYSTPKSPAFVNGALDALAKDLQKDGTIFKN